MKKVVWTILAITVWCFFLLSLSNLAGSEGKTVVAWSSLAVVVVSFIWFIVQLDGQPKEGKPRVGMLVVWADPEEIMDERLKRHLQYLLIPQHGKVKMTIATVEKDPLGGWLVTLCRDGELLQLIGGVRQVNFKLLRSAT